MSVVEFIVDGTPQTAGSKKAFAFQRKDGRLGATVVDDNPRGKDWKARVAERAAAVYLSPSLMKKPLRLYLHFVLARPLGHYAKKGGLRPSARRHPAVKPDVLKLARAVEDALTGILWHDDAQIVHEELTKSYGERARLYVRVEESE